MIISIVGVCAIIAQVISAPTDCLVNINKDTSKTLPLLLKPGTGQTREFFLPDVKGILTFKQTDTINLQCPNGFVLAGTTSTKKSSTTATCNGAGKFLVAGVKTPVTFNAISCDKAIGGTVINQGTCLNNKNNQEVQVGFQIDDGKAFFPQMWLCFDKYEQNTIYSKFTMVSTINGYQTHDRQAAFKEDPGYYSLGGQSLTKLYNRDTAISTFNTINVNGFQWIHNGECDYFLSKGHLAAKGDFIYGTQQDLTFRFLNVAPQFQTFNGGNWQTLEINVRDFASKKQYNLEVYTGTYNTLKKPNKSNQSQLINLYLYADKKTTRGVPVPEYFWKVIYDPVSKKGTAFIGANDPYNKTPTKFCNDVCSSIPWLTVSKSVKKGIIFCCDVNEFRKTTGTLPDFPVTGLLI